MKTDQKQSGDLQAEELMREVRRLEYRTRRRVDSLFAGNYHSAFKGQGIEFAEVREYEPGDDVRAIDWNVTARAGKPFIKLFVEERQLTVILAVDVSASSGFGTKGKLKSRVEIEVAAALAAAAARTQDRVGLMLFAERPELFLPPRKGRQHFLRVLRELVAHRPHGTRTDLAAAMDHVGDLQRRRAIVFLISDLITPEQSPELLTPHLRKLSARHELTVVHVRDQRESELPRAGLVRLRDAESGRTITVDASSARVRGKFAKASYERAAAIQQSIASAGAERIEVWTDRPIMPPLMANFQRRAGKVVA